MSRRAGFVGKREAKRLQRAYEARRAAWKAQHPGRTHEIDARAVYVAPVELRPRLPSDQDDAG